MGNQLSSKKKAVLDDTNYNYYCDIKKDGENIQSFPYVKRTCTFGQEYIYFDIPIKKLEPIGRELELTFYDQTIWSKDDNDGLSSHRRITMDQAVLCIFQTEPTNTKIDKVNYYEYRTISKESGTFIFRIPQENSVKHYSVVYIRSF